MKGDSRTPRHLSVLFPSLSADILGKAAPASRVRFAAHKPRALDAAAAFPIRSSGQESEGKEQQSLNPGGVHSAPPNLKS